MKWRKVIGDTFACKCYNCHRNLIAGNNHSVYLGFKDSCVGNYYCMTCKTTLSLISTHLVTDSVTEGDKGNGKLRKD